MASRQSDRARMAYGHIVEEVPRQFIIVGTTNSSEYLIDLTGNRRFWPVKVGTINVPNSREISISCGPRQSLSRQQTPASGSTKRSGTRRPQPRDADRSIRGRSSSPRPSATSTWKDPHHRRLEDPRPRKRGITIQAQNNSDRPGHARSASRREKHCSSVAKCSPYPCPRSKRVNNVHPFFPWSSRQGSEAASPRWKVSDSQQLPAMRIFSEG